MHAWQTACSGFAPFNAVGYRCHSAHIAHHRYSDMSGSVPKAWSKSCSHFARLFHFGSFHLSSRRGILSAALARHPSPICLSNLSGLGRINSLLCGFSCPSFPKLLGKHKQKLWISPCLISVEKTRLNPDLSERSVSCWPAFWRIPSDLIFYSGCVCSISACTLAGIFLWRWIVIVYWSLRVNWGAKTDAVLNVNFL